MSLTLSPRRPQPDGDNVEKRKSRRRARSISSNATRSAEEDASNYDSSDSMEAKLAEAKINYSIMCTDGKARRSKVFVLPDNPFEALIHKPKPPPSRVVIVVFIQAHGFGSSRTWTSMDPGIRAPPPPRIGPQIENRRDREQQLIYNNLPNDASTSNSSSENESASESKNRARGGESRDGATPKRRGRKLKETYYPGFDIGKFKALNVFVDGIEIRSKNLLRLFRTFVREYPTQTFRGNSIVVDRPYKLLAHYFKDLEALSMKPLLQSEPVTEDEKNEDDGLTSYEPVTAIDLETKSDLDILLNWFRPYYEKDFEPEHVRHTTGVASYPNLWFLFRPGATVYARVGGKIAGFVFGSGEERVDRMKDRFDWLAHCWNLTYNGRRIVRTVTTFTIRRFEGVKPIFSLPVFPSIYLDSTDGDKTKNRLEELGEKYYRMLRDSPLHQHYTGPTWDMKGPTRGQDQQKFLQRKPVTEYTGEIMVDHRRNSNYGDRSPSPGPPPPYYNASDREYYTSSDEEETDDDENNRGRVTQLDPKSPRKTLHAINPKEVLELTPRHYFLLPRRMDGFALASKQRLGFDIEYIQPVVWPAKDFDPMSNLILGDSDKDVIKALARKYAKHEGTWGADFIVGKGEGHIFLLHGPPGTGKTYTVECVAKFTRRPLLRLTVADIGTDERYMESVLGEWFKRGADWGAIILIDEADVFLEKRQVKDLQRNSLVSVFLSSMEYYTGMLFLTTNRIGQIDDAFLSRTSVALTYETLNIGKQQRIWDGFLKKLAEERKDIILNDRAKKFLENLDKDPTTRDVPWNGREIRNALQTAIALASYDAEKDAEVTGVKPGRIPVREEHFQAVVDRRKDFIAYRKSIRNQDEEVRAFNEGNRAPPKKNV